jgi:hypothetical protein
MSGSLLILGEAPFELVVELDRDDLGRLSDAALSSGLTGFCERCEVGLGKQDDLERGVVPNLVANVEQAIPVSDFWNRFDKERGIKTTRRHRNQPPTSATNEGRSGAVNGCLIIATNQGFRPIISRLYPLAATGASSAEHAARSPLSTALQ